MDKKKWEELVKKVKEVDVTPFELGVVAGLSSKYDFREYSTPRPDGGQKTA